MNIRCSNHFTLYGNQTITLCAFSVLSDVCHLFLSKTGKKAHRYKMKRKTKKGRKNKAWQDGIKNKFRMNSEICGQWSVVTAEHHVTRIGRHGAQKPSRLAPSPVVSGTRFSRAKHFKHYPEGPFQLSYSRSP